ncbi:MAG: HD domain-containing protein [Planctomycetes bacterium]|nr:HD domain-containing protein [Planctomycetota bacterium]
MSEPLDDPVVQRARALSESAHVAQKRDSGEPYAMHPAAVARLLVGYGVADAAVLAAAYLHDVLEDTDIDENTLHAEFGDEITGLVKELTNVGPPARRFAEKQLVLLEHARKMSPRAKRIKLADRLHNLTEMKVWPAWKQKRYANAALELLDALRPWPDEKLADDVRKAAVGYLERRDKGW